MHPIEVVASFCELCAVNEVSDDKLLDLHFWRILAHNSFIGGNIVWYLFYFVFLHFWREVDVIRDRARLTVAADHKNGLEILKRFVTESVWLIGHLLEESSHILINTVQKEIGLSLKSSLEDWHIFVVRDMHRLLVDFSQRRQVVGLHQVVSF